MTSQAYVTSSVALNKHMENPALITALAAAAQDPSEANQQKLAFQLNRATYLIAINDDNLHTSNDNLHATNDNLHDAVKPAQDHAKKGVMIKVLTCSDRQERLLLPVFTDWKEMTAFQREKMATFVMPSHQLWSFALSDAYEGIVINPAGRPLFLSLEQIRKLQLLCSLLERGRKRRR